MENEQQMEHGKQDDMTLFKAFYEEMKGEAADEETEDAICGSAP